MEAGPRRTDGFRERGAQATRIESFIDAAFAFAVTLLVISIDEIPEDFESMVRALKQTPAFAASFALVALFWHAHHMWSRRTGLDDRRSVFLSLLLVFLVLVWVYPLRMLFGAAFSWFAMITLPEAWRIPWSFQITSYEDVLTLYVIYGVAWSSLGLTIAALYHHAWRRRDDLDFDLEERVLIRGQIALWLWVPATGAMSIAIALLLPTEGPQWTLGAPGLIYFMMSLTGVVSTATERRARRQLEAEIPRP